MTVDPGLGPLRAAMREAWSGDRPVLLEGLLPLAPGLADDAECLLHVVLEEIQLRKNRAGGRKTPPEVRSEYLARFPGLADGLRDQFDLDDLFDAPWGYGPDGEGGAESGTGPEAEWIAGYRPLAMIGEGRMGTVYLATQIGLDRPVAVKLLKPGTFADAAALRRFWVEARTLAQLKSPHVVQIFEAHESENGPYLVMEFLASGSLREHLEKLKKDGAWILPVRAAQLALAIARGLVHVHGLELPIIHRDLNPKNVVLTLEGEPKLIDFGLASPVGRAEGGGRDRPDHKGALVETGVAGTASYMAPEQVEGDKYRIGPATDIYGLGATLYEMLVGRPPFEGKSPDETFARILSEAPTPPRQARPSIPRDLEAICLKCLARDPAERYATAAELVADLERFLAGEPVQARNIPAWKLLWHRARRRPALAAFVLTVLCAVVLGVIGLIAHDRQLSAANRRLLDINVALAETKVQMVLGSEGWHQNLYQVARPLPLTAHDQSEHLPAHVREEFKPIRDNLLQSWREYLRSPSVDETPLRLFNLMGYLELTLGDPGGGVEYWRQAAMLSERGMLGSPGQKKFSSESCVFALARQALVQLLADGGDTAQAPLERAFGFVRGQLHEPTSDSSYGFWALRISLQRLANWRRARGETAGVIWCLERQSELVEEFKSRDPANVFLLEYRLGAKLELAELLVQAEPRRWEEASAQLRRVVAIDYEGTYLPPTFESYLARAYQALSIIERGRGRAKAAEEISRKGALHLERYNMHQGLMNLWDF